ncbi:hypothetical protein NDU88_002554 [Pleurodeles waltl]|uniref:Uncharacterized protein n=1 Tax=Pleurodeles waltl TaxID=8319 RepID=A0AAV7Q9Q5_PLEWA|nr:hypothetical protein NDU88_002554 [Pleurodeles waltl]
MAARGPGPDPGAHQAVLSLRGAEASGDPGWPGPVGGVGPATRPGEQWRGGGRSVAFGSGVEWRGGSPLRRSRGRGGRRQKTHEAGG